MSWWGLVIRRARRAPVVDAGVVVLLVLVGVLTAVLVVAGPAVLRAAVRQHVTAAPPAQRAVEVSAARDDRAPDRQDAVARALLTGALAPLPAPVGRLLAGEPLPVRGSVADIRLVPWAGDAVAAHAVLATGRWPARSSSNATPDVEAALQADAAAALGVRVGGVLHLGRADAAAAVPPPVRVVGLWTARDPKDAFWLGEPLALTGVERAGVR